LYAASGTAVVTKTSRTSARVSLRRHKPSAKAAARTTSRARGRVWPRTQGAWFRRRRPAARPRQRHRVRSV